MDRETRTEVFTMTLSEREKAILTELAQERGSTMSGLIRRLLKDASRAKSEDQQQAEKYAVSR